MPGSEMEWAGDVLLDPVQVIISNHVPLNVAKQGFPNLNARNPSSGPIAVSLSLVCANSWCRDQARISAKLLGIARSKTNHGFVANGASFRRPHSHYMNVHTTRPIREGEQAP